MEKMKINWSESSSNTTYQVIIMRSRRTVEVAVTMFMTLSPVMMMRSRTMIELRMAMMTSSSHLMTIA
jgi:hypothetical protein